MFLLKKTSGHLWDCQKYQAGKYKYIYVYSMKTYIVWDLLGTCWGRGQKVFFNHLNRNYSIGSIYSAFFSFLAEHAVLWTFQNISQPKRKITLATVWLIQLSAIWAGLCLVLCFLFVFTIYLLRSCMHKLTSVTQVLPSYNSSYNVFCHMFFLWSFSQHIS